MWKSPAVLPSVGHVLPIRQFPALGRDPMIVGMASYPATAPQGSKTPEAAARSAMLAQREFLSRVAIVGSAFR